MSLDSPADLGIRGRAFWAEVETAKVTLDAGERQLLTEACRILDRLDRFDALISGDAKAFAMVEWPFEDAPAALVIGSVVSEARVHTAELRQVVKALNIPEAKAAGGKSEIEKMREKREAKSA